jgi:NADH:ubiquinone oxidoreductase subunit 6 (subunit J)
MIYVGGIALLFLFVIIMLNLKGLDKKGSKRSNNLLIRAFFIFLSAVTFQNFFYIHINKSTYNKELPLNKFFIKEFFNEDIVVFEILYTHYFFYLILAGIVLLASMVGVILLTLNTNAPSKVRYKKII